MATESEADLGQRLRELRTRNRWRIADVSRMTGLATSTISKVENGHMSLTYDKLQQLARGLSLELSELFTDAKRTEAPALGAARRSVGRAGDGVILQAGSYEYRFLNADLVPKQMVPIVGVATARTLEEFGPLIKHEGEEFLFVLQGAIEVHAEFYAPVVLQAGDHIYIDSRMGHAYLAAADETCQVLVVCTGEADELQRAVAIQQQVPETQRRPPGRPPVRKTDGKADARSAKPRRPRK
jgi:transcriptional regulator with XRE-family HTH domain/mannose-6-phosphate isomerase-like protein (cupin superfamily)